MPKPKSQKARLLAIAKQKKIFRSRDVCASGIPREYITRLLAEGLLERRGRGLYVLVGARQTKHRILAEVAKRVPHGVISLLSALQFHKIGTQIPSQVWLTIPEKARLPRTTYPPLRIVRFSGSALTKNIKRYKIEGVQVRIYDPAKTVADCFKYRNKIGLNVALGALHHCHRKRKATIKELRKAARICRVENVMRPYLNDITGDKPL